MQCNSPCRWFVSLPLALGLVACSSESADVGGAAGALTGGGPSALTGGNNQGGDANASGGAGASGSSASGSSASDSSASGAAETGGASDSEGGGMSLGGAGGATANSSGGAAGSTASGGTSGNGGKGVGGASSGGAGGSTHAGPWKIMPLGDSITGYCYPQNLAGELMASGVSNSQVTFIGTVTNNQKCNSPTVSTLKTEGHGCYDVTYLERDITPVAGCDGTKGTLSELKTWAAEKPDVVLMEIGTNDVWGSRPTADITAAYSFVVDHFRSQNPSVIFFVAQITPMNPGSSSQGKITLSCPACEGRVEALNSAIPGWASGNGTAASPIYVVNVWSALDKATYLPGSMFTADGVHPAAPASKLMADKWHAALTAHGIP